MSLTSLLMKQQLHVPENILSVISTADDRTMVENICAVVQSVVPCADLSAALITECAEKYKVVIPLTGNAAIAYTDIRTIFNSYVSRISDIVVNISESTHVVDERELRTPRVCLTVHVNKHSSRIPVSQLDIIRVTKKTRWF